jgi:EAL domain-containing protein (putative c-di-GMP-specific phosphodiesterase class I)
VARLQLETDLRRAVERGELVVHYQPVVTVATGRIAGFEALVRWLHPERGLILPAEFISTAEETGLIVELGEQVLSSACARLALFQERAEGGEPLFMSVNLSARQFRQADLAERVAASVRSAGIAPSSLNLEITESALMEGSERHLGVVRELRELGVNLHIDDFGTGYSSLSYLHQFSIQALKIDRSFIRHLEDGEGHGEIVESIITLASNLGIEVIAEGVETEIQRVLLARLRCPMAQGFLFSKPVEASEAERLLPGHWGGPRLVLDDLKEA